MGRLPLQKDFDNYSKINNKDEGERVEGKSSMNQSIATCFIEPKRKESQYKHKLDFGYSLFIYTKVVGLTNKRREKYLFFTIDYSGSPFVEKSEKSD